MVVGVEGALGVLDVAAFGFVGGVFEHGMIIIAEFEVEGEFAAEELAVAEGAGFVLEVLGHELILGLLKENTFGELNFLHE